MHYSSLHCAAFAFDSIALWVTSNPDVTSKMIIVGTWQNGHTAKKTICVHQNTQSLKREHAQLSLCNLAKTETWLSKSYPSTRPQTDCYLFWCVLINADSFSRVLIHCDSWWSFLAPLMLPKVLPDTLPKPQEYIYENKKSTKWNMNMLSTSRIFIFFKMCAQSRCSPWGPCFSFEAPKGDPSSRNGLPAGDVWTNSQIITWIKNYMFVTRKAERILFDFSTSAHAHSQVGSLEPSC